MLFRNKLLVIFGFLFFFSCSSNKADLKKPEEIGIFPLYGAHYFEGKYYFPALSKDSIFLYSVDESSKKVISKTFIEKTDGGPPNLDKDVVFVDSLMFYPIEDNIVCINYQSGEKIRSMSVGCNVFKLNSHNNDIYSCCYKGKNLNVFSYFSFRKDDLSSTNIIYEHSISNNEKFVGWPPIPLDSSKYLAPMLMFDPVSYNTINILLLLQNNKIINSKKYCFKNNKGLGQSEEFALHDSFIYLRCYNMIYKYDPKMNLIWNTDLRRESATSNIHIAQNKVYALNENKSLLILDKKSGKILAEKKVAGTSGKMKSDYNSVFFIGGSDGKLYITNIASDKIKLVSHPQGQAFNRIFGLGEKTILLFDNLGFMLIEKN